MKRSRLTQTEDLITGSAVGNKERAGCASDIARRVGGAGGVLFWQLVAILTGKLNREFLSGTLCEIT
jgi:hypothetical protein